MQGRRVLAQPLGQLRVEVDRLFNDFMGTLSQLPTPAFVSRRGFPALNVWETADAVHVEAELPGMHVEELEIAVVGKDLTLKGERAADTIEGMTFHRRERSVENFTRRLTLPADVKSDAVEATLRDGVLHITLPKDQESRSRKIVINRG